MPIKFRCAYCRQFLGISRSKAGAAVDCPTCGRAVRVPDLDGTVAPLPQPGLNLQDVRLAEALDELAGIGQDGGFEEDEDLSDAAEPLAAPVVAPVPLPTPVPIDPPLPAEPAKPQPVPVPPAGRDGATPLPERLDERDVAAELAGLAAVSVSAAEPSALPTAPASGRRIGGLFALAAALLAGGFALGFAVAWMTADGTTDRAAAAASPARGASATAHDLVPSEPAPAESGVFGRVTYKTTDGLSRADGGARILALPRPSGRETKLSPTGFHAAADSSEFKDAAAALRERGGAVAVADAQGRFRLALPTPGTYWMLVLSHYQPHDGPRPADTALQDRLADYFDRPDRLLGRRAAHLGLLRYAANEPVVWDHSFEPVF